MKILKVAIIGAGFAGLIFSNYLLKAGIDVDLYEEHDKVGIPEHCTGIVSYLTTKLIGEVSNKNIIKRYIGLEISSYKEQANIYTKDPIIKLNRVNLENDLLNYFEERGGNVFLKTRIKEINSGYINNKKYDAIIISDGINGFLHKKFELGFVGRTIYGINQEFCVNDISNIFKVKFDKETSHNFFSWYVPLDNRVIIGTGVEDPKKLVSSQENAIKAFNIKSKPCHTYGGIIISGINKTKIRNNSVIAIGDSIGLTKPLTGGGLFPNSLSAYFSYYLIRKGYNVLDSIETSINFVLSLLRKTNNLSIIVQKKPELVEEIIETAKKSKLLYDINGKVDYDLHNSVIEASIKSKNSYKFFLNFINKDPWLFLNLSQGLLKDLI